MSQEEIQIPEGWKLTKLGDIGEYKYGYSGKATSDNSGKPYLRITDINFDGSLKQGRVFVSISDDDFNRYQLKNNDIVIARTGATVGKSFLFNGGNDFVFASYLIRYRFNKEKVIPKFLHYVLQSPSFWKYIGISQSGGAQPNVNATKMSKFEFYLPPTDIQKKITEKLDYILERLEEKKKQVISLIEQNKERINFFEKNWFIFLINNEIEKHPQRKKWGSKKLDTLATIGQGGTPSRAKLEYWNGDIPWLSSGEIRNNVIIDSKEKITQLGLKNSSTQLCPKNTILIAMTGQGLTRGRTALLRIKACANQSCSHMIIKDQQLIPEYLWLYLQSQYWKIRSIHHGSGQPGINTSMIKSWEIPIPSIDIQKKIIQNMTNAKEEFELQKTQFGNIKGNYESRIKYINHIQSSILDSAFSGKLVN